MHEKHKLVNQNFLNITNMSFVFFYDEQIPKKMEKMTYLFGYLML